MHCAQVSMQLQFISVHLFKGSATDPCTFWQSLRLIVAKFSFYLKIFEESNQVMSPAIG